MGSKRRYDIKGAPKEMVEHYHDRFDNLRINSELLNSFKGVPDVYSKMWDRRTLEVELEDKKTQLVELKKRLDDVDKDFEYHQQQVINQGFHKPTTLSPELLQRRYRLEASYDVVLEEVEWLGDKIKNYDETEIRKTDSRVLQNGLRGGGRLYDGMLVEIFGMRVTKNDKDILIIDQPGCYLDGMSVIDVRDLSERWCKARFTLDKEKRKLIQRFHAKGCDQKEIDQEWTARRNQLFTEHPDWNDLFAVQLPHKPAMPEWPAGVKNWKQNGQPTESEKKPVKRMMRRGVKS